jgi:hypothetical protein
MSERLNKKFLTILKKYYNFWNEPALGQGVP